MSGFIGLLAEGWGDWWLPTNYSTHGGAIDSLFNWIFWITMVTFVLVEAVLVIFLIKYRYRKDRKKAVFTHGNTRLEMAWTLAPAVILAVLALASKRVWDGFRYQTPENSTNAARIMVVGQQFKWNVIYPGPDGKLGKYLIFPKPTDLKWPDGKSYAGVPGPAHLPYDQAISAINKYIDQNNPLGKDFSDPDGKDDDYQKALARELFIPVNRPVEIHLGSKDVLHDFFLPNYRVKLDAVPGLRGLIHFTAIKTSAQVEQETRKTYSIEELESIIALPENKELTVAIDENSPGAAYDKKFKQYLYQDTTTNPKKPATIIRNAKVLTKDVLAKLKTAGIAQVTAYRPGYWDLVCEELCGMGHNTMQGRLVVLDQDEYKRRFETGAGPNIALNTNP